MSRALAAYVREARRLPAPADARAIRLAADVSQKRLADEIGVHRVTVVRWEHGERAPRGPLRLRYIALLDELRAAVGGSLNDHDPDANRAVEKKGADAAHRSE